MQHSLIGLSLAFGLALGLAPMRAEAGCAINIKWKNSSYAPKSPDGKKAGHVYFDRASKVRIKGGTWRKIWKVMRDDFDHLITSTAKGESKSRVYKAAFSCKKQRQFKFVLVCVNGKAAQGVGPVDKVSFYKPSSSGWSRKGTTTIDLGDVGRRCPQ